jgi:hypothetical protein
MAVLINEISPMPLSDDEPTWVELLNVAEAPVDISGWSLWDRWGCRFVFPARASELPPGGLIVVWFLRSKEMPLGRTFRREGAVHLEEVGDDAADAFRGRASECALFATSEARPEALVDFVCWARGPRPQTAAILQDAHVSETLLEPVVAVGESWLRRGESIGRTPSGEHLTASAAPLSGMGSSRAWAVYAPGDVTPGKANPWPAPVARSPMSWVTANAVEFSVAWPPPLSAPPGRRVRLQVAERSFEQHCVVDRLFDAGERLIVDNLPFGEYYWRTRVEDGDVQSRWSRGQWFHLLDPSIYGPGR